MTDAALKTGTDEIVVEDVLPFPPARIWQALTSGAMMARWLMEPAGFEPVVGNRFTFKTTPAGGWDGFIRCEVLEIVPGQRFAFRWQGGHADNVGYGSLLDTLVTFTLAPDGQGTRLKMVHSGFERPKNEIAYTNMSDGWVKVIDRLETVAEQSD
ncbi:SRPBCC family protein [Sphingobium nicotianae]|uniref:SRPBCC domain-containing protein n=1 Tax=Sphingobium nicotianae TaxID=2782607 RepID=A0A9X1DCV5_9SPHN|nr:SRPBCC domain-containing protein [Sphingobium nicotianae]MBT2187535.1 SRPBCC domain-containing protein [Sphingobium nicotianae]